MEIQTLREEATEIQDRTTALRHHLHRHPELGNYLPLTREAVLTELEDLPLEITLHESTSGIAALLTGSRPGPTVMLRGDMDALPLTEDTGVEFSSTIDCQMHACGHDTHTAMLASAARVLAGRRNDFAGRVLFMFQPGEEGHHGARFMLDEGLLNVPHFPDGTPSPVTGAFALHMTASLPSGWVATRRGPIMAAADEFVIRITGRGGHASEPFRALDPIPIACEIVQALQMMITRSVDVFDPAVVTVGQIHAGTTNNIIPEIAEINGTIRTVSEHTRSKVHDSLKRVAEGIASAHGAEVMIDLEIGYPVTTNSDRFADFTVDVARELLGTPAVHTLPNPIMGAEDFSYVLNKVPGTMMFLGGTPHSKDPRTAAPNHSNRVMFEDEAMITGVALYSAMALRHLAQD
jgi:hippurate hydrolase